jgi:hypothetical protein
MHPTTSTGTISMKNNILFAGLFLWMVMLSYQLLMSSNTKQLGNSYASVDRLRLTEIEKNILLIENKISSSDAEIRQLNEINENTLSELKKIHAKLNRLKQTSPEIKQQEHSKNVLPLPTKKAQNQIAKKSIKSKQDRYFQFSNEFIDYEWAPMIESSLTEMFSDQKLLADIPFESIECRTSICKISIYSENLVGMNVMMSVVQSMSEYKNLKTKTFSFDHDGSSGTFEMYLWEESD